MVALALFSCKLGRSANGLANTSHRDHGPLSIIENPWQLSKALSVTRRC